MSISTPGKLWRLLEMLEVMARSFAVAMDHIGQLLAAEKQVGPIEGPYISQADFTDNIASPIAELQGCLMALELRGSLVSLDRLNATLNQYPIPFDELKRYIYELRQRIFDELDSTKFILIELKSLEFFEQKAPLCGVGVDRKFPGASEDISEAGKCFALERYTASIFHLMRAMEVALREVAINIGASIQGKDGVFLPWGVIVQNVKAKIDALPKGDGQTTWYSTYAMLEAVNRAWRNPTMHPKQTYSEREARDIFNAVKSFMTALGAHV